MPEPQALPVPGAWELGLTDAAVAQRLADKQSRRPVALHPFGVGKLRKWHLSWVKNSGADFQEWSWTQGMSVPALVGQVSARKRVRLFLVEPVPGSDEMAAVWLIRPADPSLPWPEWDWSPDIASSDLSATVPAGYRLTCVRALGKGATRVAAIWVADDSGTPWDWHHSITFDELHETVRDTGSRIVSLDAHGAGAQLRFCAAWVANTGTTARTWYWFAGVDEPYLRGQSNGLCSHPVELCHLGGEQLATVLNRTPAPGDPPDDILLDVTGSTSLQAFANDAAQNNQVAIAGTVDVQVANVTNTDVEIVGAGLRWATSGAQMDSLPDTSMPPPPNPLDGTTVIPPNTSVSPPVPINVSTGIEYRDILVFIDAKTADGRRQRILRPLPVQRSGFPAHNIPPLNEPVALTTWTSEAEVVPMWRAGRVMPWVNVAGTVVNLTGDPLSLTRMDVEVVADGSWILEENLPLRFHQSLWPDERGCGELNGQPGCAVVEAAPDGTLQLGDNVLSRFVRGFELPIRPNFVEGHLRIILHYQRRRRCGSVLRDLPLRWIEPLDVSPPVRGEFNWGNAFDHVDFDAHAWPGPRLSWDIAPLDGDGGQDLYPMAGGVVIEVGTPAPTPGDPNPNHWVTMWHPGVELWTGYFHLEPGSVTVSPQDAVSADIPFAQLGSSGTLAPHLHTGHHVLDATGLGRVTALRFAGLVDADGKQATQTPATGVYTS